MKPFFHGAYADTWLGYYRRAQAGKVISRKPEIVPALASMSQIVRAPSDNGNDRPSLTSDLQAPPLAIVCC